MTLVPVPRSAPLPDGALWPAKVICDVLLEHGFGHDIQTLLRRTKAVQKSSTSPADGRPLVPIHIDSIEAERPLFPPQKITIVDDVITKGVTSFACAEIIKSICPSAKIRIFAMIRTQGLLENIEMITDPSTGIITGYPSGKTHRVP